MKATVTSVSEKPSNYGGYAYLITFAGEDGKSYRTWVATNNGNFQRWLQIIQYGKGCVVDNLVIKGSGRLVNADSFPTIV